MIESWQILSLAAVLLTIWAAWMVVMATTISMELRIERIKQATDAKIKSGEIAQTQLDDLVEFFEKRLGLTPVEIESALEKAYHRRKEDS